MSEYNQNQKAITFAKKHRKDIAKKIIQGYSSGEKPLAIFMAGAPGAKKNYQRHFHQKTYWVSRNNSDNLQ